MEQLFGELIDYGKHKSSYFDLDAGIVTVIAYLLPGILGMIWSGFSYFATLILIAVAAFEKKSGMVKLYCLQFCFYSMFFNIILSLLTVIANAVTPLAVVTVLLSTVVSILTVIVFFYSLFRALQYKFWKMPVVGDFIIRRFVK